MRSLDELFTGLTEDQREEIFDSRGFSNTFLRNETPQITPAAGSGINLMPIVMEKIPAQLVEVLAVVPYNTRPLYRLDIYNAFGRIRNLSAYRINSRSRGNIPLFEETTRLEAPNRNRPIPDPPPALIVPASDTVFLRIKDSFFGNTYFRGTFTLNAAHGITYRLTNTAAVWYLIFPVMGAEQLALVVHAEPIDEGVLLYGLAGIDIPMYIATTINLTANINMRIRVIMNWLTDSLSAIK